VDPQRAARFLRPVDHYRVAGGELPRITRDASAEQQLIVAQLVVCFHITQDLAQHAGPQRVLIWDCHRVPAADLGLDTDMAAFAAQFDIAEPSEQPDQLAASNVTR
jgi:hypothetical protein